MTAKRAKTVDLSDQKLFRLNYSFFLFLLLNANGFSLCIYSLHKSIQRNRIVLTIMITSSLAAVGGVSVFRVSRASSSHSFMMNRNIVVVLVFVLVAGAIHVDDLMSACPPLPPHTPQDINDLSPSVFNMTSCILEDAANLPFRTLKLSWH